MLLIYSYTHTTWEVKEEGSKDNLHYAAKFHTSLSYKMKNETVSTKQEKEKQKKIYFRKRLLEQEKLPLCTNSILLPTNINCNIGMLLGKVLTKTTCHNLSHHSFQASEDQNVSCLYL